MSIGKRLRFIRGKMKQHDFAELLSVHPNTIARYERDERSPNSAFIERIAKVAGVNIQWLTTGDGPMKEKDRKRFNLELMASIIEALDNYETSLGEKFTAIEKTLRIIYVYYLYTDAESAVYQKRFSTIDTIKGVENIFSILDTMIGNKEERTEAEKIYKKVFTAFLSEESADLAARVLIASKLKKLHNK